MLIEANLVGHDSHGIHYVTRYAERIKNGTIDPTARPEVTNDTPSTAIIDGHWTFGQVTATKATRLAIEKAKKTSISAVGAIHCNHIGRLGAYTMLAAESDMVGFLMANVVHPVVQPFGGASRVFGTNPISVAAPAGEEKPFLLDFATSSVAEGKVGVAAMSREKIPLGWIVDNDGHDTDDPLDFSLQNGSVGENGRLLSFGARDGHKGYCLSILMEILGGILPGGGSIVDEDAHVYENGLLVIALDIKKFTPLKRFKSRMDSLFKKVHSSPVNPEFQYDEVQVPGNYEWRNREKRLKEGIDVPQPTWDQIRSLAAELNVNSKPPSSK
jgi:LDH2 family malate/lactate/ureidoglycolate dehydrogenase